MKRTDVLKMDAQFGFFERMSQLVREGTVAFPPQVPRELAVVQYPDTPGTWAVGVSGSVIYPQPRDESLAEVLAVAQLIDPGRVDAGGEADPHVVAMAYEMREKYPESAIIVVSDDTVDRMPRKESVSTACERLGLPCICGLEFVDIFRT